MKAKEHTEEVLKSIHVLFSKAAPYAGSKFKVIIDKERMMGLLKELNNCMYDMMDEYELTLNSREKADREAQRQGAERVLEARKKAEDIYAASLMYSDRALEELRHAMNESEEKLAKIQSDLRETIRSKEKEMRDNQLELKSQLNNLIDTQKYLRLIEDENAKREKERERKQAQQEEKERPRQETEIKDKATPEIHVNEEYFEKLRKITAQGRPENLTNHPQTEDETRINDESVTVEQQEDATVIPEEELARLDEEYFAWKDDNAQDESGEEIKKKSFALFGKKEE